MLSNPLIIRNKLGLVSISCRTPDPKIYYTLDGSEPDLSSNFYEAPFDFSDGGEVRAIAVIQDGMEKSETVVSRFDISAAKWILKSVSSGHKGFEGEKAIDGNTSTIWHTSWGEDKTDHPHSIEIDLGESLTLSGFSYTPRTDGIVGICKEFLVEVSEDGTVWQQGATGTFDNIRNNPVRQEVRFSKSVKAKYIRFTSISNVKGDEYLSAAELGVLTR